MQKHQQFVYQPQSDCMCLKRIHVCIYDVMTTKPQHQEQPLQQSAPYKTISNNVQTSHPLLIFRTVMCLQIELAELKTQKWQH